jgi:ankyrin repeat protein
MCAARNSWPRFVEMLLKVGANPNAVDAEGSTPMAHAVLGQSLDSIKLLLEFRARTDYRDPQGRNLAQIAKHEHYHRICYHLAPYMAYP